MATKLKPKHRHVSCDLKVVKQQDKENNSGDCNDLSDEIEDQSENLEEVSRKPLNRHPATINLHQNPDPPRITTEQYLSPNDTPSSYELPSNRREGGLKNTTSSASIESGYGSSRHTSATNTPGIPEEKETTENGEDIPVPKPILANQESKVELQVKDDELQDDSPIKPQPRKKTSLPLHLCHGQNNPGFPVPSSSHQLPQVYRRNSIENSSLCPPVVHQPSVPLRSLSDDENSVSYIRIRKNASKLTKSDEKRLEKAVRENMKLFVRWTDFVVLLPGLYSTRLISSVDAEYLTNDKRTEREKANHFYMVVLAKKGRKAYRLLYQCLSEEYENRGHRHLLHILDRVVGYMQDSTSSESSSSSSEAITRVDASDSSAESGGSLSNLFRSATVLDGTDNSLVDGVTDGLQKILQATSKFDNQETQQADRRDS